MGLVVQTQLGTQTSGFVTSTLRCGDEVVVANFDDKKAFAA